mgnify:CR=1 FL=1
MNKDPTLPSLPNDVLLHIFNFLHFDDLFNIQQVCHQFRTIVDDEKRNEIEADWRLKKLSTEFSACGAIKTLERAKMKKGKYSLNLTYIPATRILRYRGDRKTEEMTEKHENLEKTVFNEVCITRLPLLRGITSTFYFTSMSPNCYVLPFCCQVFTAYQN